MSTLIVLNELGPNEQEAIDNAIVTGDYSKLTPRLLAHDYKATCSSLKLNMLSRPIDYIVMKGRLVKYYNKNCSDQLRCLYEISIKVTSCEVQNDIYIVTVVAQDKSGRVDSSTGAVPIGKLTGDALANAFMKAETKAKRRVTLSIAGVSGIDETEIDSIQGATRVNVDIETGEIIGAPKNLAVAACADIDLLHLIQDCCHANDSGEGVRAKNILSEMKKTSAEKANHTWNLLKKEEKEWIKSLDRDKK